ncbi:membrane dipeptidase [Chloroflexota bacterium]|nr:membrane dipeptidase [Chloroflexota bacterium]
MTLIIDSHEDLAWNMVNLARDYTKSALETRSSERNTPIPAYNGNTLLGRPEYVQSKVALVFGTLYVSPRRLEKGSYPVETYETPQQAHQAYRKQLDAYFRLADEQPNDFTLIFSQSDLQAHWKTWQAFDIDDTLPAPPTGIVVLMEGAECVVEPAQVADWFEWGVRLIGPAWAGNRYCGGTREPGPLTKLGYELLDRMADQGFILDISHMDHESARQSLDCYPGQVIASHANAEALIRDLPINRHLKDATIHQLIERNGVMGIVPLNGFLDWGWQDRGGRASMSLELVADQIDYVCQLAGDSRHVALGTDFDGGFGVEKVPMELNTIADLTQLDPLLKKRGYNQEDIARIFHGNWYRILQENLPSS